MTSPVSTEDYPDATQWLDQLNNADAIAVMLDNQAGAISALKAASSSLDDAIAAMAERLKLSSTGRIIYTGAGTSARIGVQDGVELTPTFNWPQDRLDYIIAGGMEALMQSVEGAEDEAEAGQKAVALAAINEQDVVIGLAASGTTDFTIAVLAAARQMGALTIGIANNRAMPLLSVAEYSILLDTGGEALAGSTRLKAGTAQKICLNTMSTLVMARLGRIKHGLMVAMQPTNAKLVRRKAQMDSYLSSMANHHSDKNS
ncbi:MAG: N-acetylmuramic acid 6-phosphate etherase [Alphaproteobacteria bacterium]|nr:N-acetylmuramic acid 6-phosphate etherase [Alphaproteobacteria bacterium]